MPIYSYMRLYTMTKTKTLTEKKEYEECQSFQECVDELVRRTMVRIEEKMPDEGGFPDIFELFCNPDAGTSDIVGKYGLHVFKMRSDVEPDPKMRYVQACAYIPSAEYKATLMAGSGTKAEILALMNDPVFANKLNYTFGELLDMLQDF